jgi:hemolysin activation/secretion protein
MLRSPLYFWPPLLSGSLWIFWGFQTLAYGQATTGVAPAPPLQAQALPAPETVLPPREAPPLVPGFLETDPLDDSVVPPAGPPTFISPEAIPEDSPTQFVVEDIRFLGNTAFSSEELNAVVEALLTQGPVTVAEIYWAAEQIAQYYYQAGYITTGALPEALLNPAGDLTFVEDGTLTFHVIEGSIEDIEVFGVNRLDEGYVRARLELTTQAPLQEQQLIDALQLLHNDPLIESVSVVLDGGTAVGTNTLQITVQEADSFTASGFVDNRRSPNIGSLQQGVQISEGNLLGLGDRLAMTYSRTEGSNAVGLSYTLPLNPHGSDLRLSYSYGRNRFITRPISLLDLESTSSTVDITWQYPLIRTPREEFSIGVTGSWRQSQVVFGESIFGFPLGFPTPGADADGRSRVTALRFFQEGFTRNEFEVFAARSQFSLGLGNTFGGTVNAEAPDNRFFSWRGQAQYQRLLAPDTIFQVQAGVQLANRPLLPVEQFGLGGSGSVRGYRQDFLLADNGAFVSAEVWLPIARLPDIDGLLQVTPFVDMGRVWNSDAETLLANDLASVGLGLRWQQGNLAARLDWGIPLIGLEGGDRTWQENGLHFSLTVSEL